MRCGYFDCFSGAAGDMILGAMAHAGLSPDLLREVVARLGIPGIELQVRKVDRRGLAATHVNVSLSADVQPKHRHLPEILEIIRHSGLSQSVIDRATHIFTRLAQAEAAVHGVPPERVHFHEVGAADALVDIVGACAGLEGLQIERVVCSPLPTGSGSVHCEHGWLPVPAPATAELLRGVPLAPSDQPGELTTPTGAAILTSLAHSFGPLPPMRIASIGYGAGTRCDGPRPNVLRLLIGELTDSPGNDRERLTVLETQVDDATGQTVAFAIWRLLEAGALDAFSIPIVMKKGRPGQLLTVLCAPEQVDLMEEILFEETTTFGVRRHECLRRALPRRHVTVQTEFGPIRVKVGQRGDRVRQAWPEFEDCAVAARRCNVPLRTVQQAALHRWSQKQVREPNAHDA